MSNICKKLNTRIEAYLVKVEKKILQEIQTDEKLKQHKVYQCSGFEILNSDAAKAKREEQLENGIKSRMDPRNRLTKKSTKIYANLGKKGNLHIKTTLNFWAIKVKKQGRKQLAHGNHNFKNRTTPYPSLNNHSPLNRNQHKVNNFVSLVNTWRTEPDEICFV